MNMNENPALVAQALMAFALDTSAAAQELLEAGKTGGALSDNASRIIEIWRGLAAPTARYAHPTAEAIAADEETADFAIVCALRALVDALGRTSLTRELQQFTAASLLATLGARETNYVALDEAHMQIGAKVPFDKAMRTLSKALAMATLHGRDGKVLPAEMLDYVREAALMVEQNRIDVEPARFKLFPDLAGQIQGVPLPHIPTHHVVTAPLNLRAGAAGAQA